MPRAVVFAYHNVGARCLRVLLAHGVEVPLVVTHVDDANENLWFERVTDVAASYGLPTTTADDANADAFVARVRSLAPDFIFSFYYRKMLPSALLAIAQRGALNMHGSLLPKYRGRAPVNWAVLNGERETGATRSEEHTSELQSRRDLVCRLLLEKKKKQKNRKQRKKKDV